MIQYSRRHNGHFLYSMIVVAMAQCCFAADPLPPASDGNFLNPIVEARLSSESSRPAQPSCGLGHCIASTGVKTIFGAGGGALGLFFGGLLGATIEKSFFKDDGFLTGLTGFLIGAPIGYLFCEPAGVCIGAETFGERGSYWGSFLGNAAGCAFGIGLIALLKANSPGFDGNGKFQTTIMITIPLGGSILGYDYLFKPQRHSSY